MAERRAIHEFLTGTPTQQSLFLMDSVDSGASSGYTTEKASLAELGAVLGAILYTQLLDTNVKNIFGGINELFARCMNIADDYDDTETYDTGDYVFYQNVFYKCNDDGVTGTWDATKWDATTVAEELATGGSGGDVGIECTQAQYDAWEQAGTLLEDTNYYITDGQSGGGVVIDDTTASTTTVYSSDKVEDLLSDKQDTTDNSLTTTDKTIVGAINELKSGVNANTTRLTNFIVSETVYDQTVTITVASPLVVTMPNKTGYTAIGLGTTYAGGSSSIMFVMDTLNRIHCRNVSGVDFTGKVTIKVIYAKN